LYLYTLFHYYQNQTKPLLQYNRSFEDLYRLGERGTVFPEKIFKKNEETKTKIKIKEKKAKKKLLYKKVSCCKYALISRR